MTTPIQKGDSILRPRARIIKTIGEELISNDVVAIIELVKNSYDADASIIVITFEGKVEEQEEGIKKRKKKVLLNEGAKITIYDDGTGMSLNTIQTAWMEPATIIKKKSRHSPGLKRKYTGEKGIGRFASAKLSSHLKIITKEINDNEVVADFNWESFSHDDKYLDQIKCKWEVRKPSQLDNHGTILILNDLNSDWDEDKIRTLRVALSRLVNPIAPIPNFLIELSLPKELSEYSDLISAPDSLNKPDYLIKGKVDEAGIADLTYKSRNTKLKKYKLEIKLKPDRKPKTGPFTFEFRVWDRDRESLNRLAAEVGSTIKNIRGDLDDLGGISIYRDNFRVLPYGEPKNDWLRLDLRRVNNPTLRISNNQIVGYISTSLDNNPDLKDQSNREGLIDSQAFNDLQEIIKSILNELEVKRYEERPREEKKDKSQNLFENFSIEPVKQVIQKKLPQDKEVKSVLEETEKSISEGVRKVQEVLSRYRRLSTLGLLLDVVLHDGNNFLLAIDSKVRLLEKELNKPNSKEKLIKEYIEGIQQGRKVLSQLFKRLEPFSGRKRGRPKDIVLEKSIRNIFELFKTDIDRLEIILDLPDGNTIVKIDESELQMIFANLLQNSIYWLESREKQRKIVVEVERNDDNISVLFCDNGPGIKNEHYDLIFDPYFSTKPDGIGLGLTIVGEIMIEYDGDLLLIDNGPLDGAAFKLVFRKRI